MQSLSTIQIAVPLSVAHLLPSLSAPATFCLAFQIANVAFMETHLPPSDDNPLTQHGQCHAKCEEEHTHWTRRPRQGRAAWESE